MGTGKRPAAISSMGTRDRAVGSSASVSEDWGDLGFTAEEAQQYIEYLGEDRAYAWAKATVDQIDRLPDGVNVSIVADWADQFHKSEASTAMAYYAAGIDNPGEAREDMEKGFTPAMIGRDNFLEEHFDEWNKGIEKGMKADTTDAMGDFKTKMLAKANAEGFNKKEIEEISKWFDREYTDAIAEKGGDLEEIEMGGEGAWPKDLSTDRLAGMLYGSEEYDGEDQMPDDDPDYPRVEKEYFRRKEMREMIANHKANAVLLKAFPGASFEVDGDTAKWTMGPNERLVGEALKEAGFSKVRIMVHKGPIIPKGTIGWDGKNFTNRPNGMWIQDVARNLRDGDLERAYNDWNHRESQIDFATESISEPLRKEMLSRGMEPKMRIARRIPPPSMFPNQNDTPLGLSDREWEEMKRTPSAKASTGRRTPAGKKGKPSSGSKASTGGKKPAKRPKPKRFYLKDAQKNDRGSRVRLIEMTLETSTTVPNNVPLTMQFFNDWQTYGLDEAIAYGEQYETKGDYETGTMAEIKKIRDKWYKTLFAPE